MKRLIAGICVMLCLSMGLALASADSIHVEADGQTLTVYLEDNEAASRLYEILETGPVTVSLQSYGGFEAYGYLPEALESDDQQMTAGPGDVVLYGGNSIVFFYGSNDWEYTRLGTLKEKDASLLRNLFGNSTTVTLTR